MKTVLITGASTGLGYETVRQLIQQNHRVIAIVRTLADEEKLKSELGKDLIVLRLDLTDFSAVEKIPIELQKNYKIHYLDVLINNAGMALAGPFLNQKFDEIQNTLQLNVLSVMKLTQVLLPSLGAQKQFTQSPGRIINISSIAGKSGTPFLAVYAASKHAIEGFSDSLRKEMMLFGIKVIVIGPGSIKTPIWQKGFEKIKDLYGETLFAKPFKKFIQIALDEEKNALEVTKVAGIILQATEVANPAFRYAPIPRKWRNWYLPELMPKKILNHLTAKLLGLSR